MQNQRKSELASLEKLLNDSKSFIKRTSDDKLSETLGGKNYYIYDLKPSDQNASLIKQNQQIIKIRLIEPIDEKGSTIKNLPCLLYIRYANGTRETLQISPNKIDELRSTEFFEKRTNAYARAEASIYGGNDASMDDWKEGIEEHYTSETYKTYDYLGALITENIKKQTNPEKKYNIVDVGCGDGSFLLKYISSMSNFNWIGIDLSEKNIIKARSKADTEAKDRFIIDNMLNVNLIIDKAIKDKQLSPTSPFIITSLGSITRLVLPNGFIAAKVLQELYKIKGLQVIFGGGVGDPLITTHIAKRIGFQLDIRDSGEKQFFKLEKIDEKEILQNKIAKIQKSRLLDLSLSSIPETLLINPDILSAIEESKKPIMIDLSFCQLNEKLLNTLLEIMKKNDLGNIKLRYFDNNTDQIIQFKQKFSEYKDQIETYLAKNHEDILLMAPRKFFESITPHFNPNPSIQTLKKNHQFTLNYVYHLKDEMSPDEFKSMIKECFLYDIKTASLDTIKKYKILYPEWMPEFLEQDENTLPGRTPIFSAVARKDKEALSIIQFLLENKVHFMQKDWEDDRAIQQAIRQRNFKMVKVLREYDKETKIEPEIKSFIRISLDEHFTHYLKNTLSNTELQTLLNSPDDLFIKQLEKSGYQLIEQNPELKEVITDYPDLFQSILKQTTEEILSTIKGRQEQSLEDQNTNIIQYIYDLQHFIIELRELDIKPLNEECTTADKASMENSTQSKQIMQNLYQIAQTILSSQSSDKDPVFFKSGDKTKLETILNKWKGKAQGDELKKENGFIKHSSSL